MRCVRKFHGMRHPELITMLLRSMVGAIGAILSAVPALAATAPSGSCAAVEVIGARGTGEPSGFGYLLTPIAQDIQNSSTKTVGLYPLPYPASGDYQTSESTGVSDLQNYLKSEAKACPAQSFVLLGYSQGAQVVGDVIASGLANPQMSQIVSVTLFGNPRFNSAEKFDLSTYKVGVNGILTARPTGSFSGYAGKVQDYCHGNDGICQSGQSLYGHLTYSSNASQAEGFVLDKLR